MNNNELVNTIDYFYSEMNNYNKNAIDIICNLYTENINKYYDVLNKRDNKLEFNLFDVITHKWNKEKLHSELLKFFLNNYEDFFYNFLDLIGIENKDDYSNAEIPEYEKNYIDISIIGNKKIIIIENKINWAKDQQEQLANYYKKVCGEYEVEKIVYIAPSKYKEPEEHTFGFDNEIKNQVKDKYIKIISFDATDKDLVTCFEKSRYNFKDDKLFFMNHYIEILKRTGEGDMSETELNFFNEILNKYKEDNQIFQKINYIGKMYNNLAKIQNDYIISKTGMDDWGYDKNVDYYSCAHYIELKRNNAVYIVIYTYTTNVSGEIYLSVYDDKNKCADVIYNILSKYLNEEEIKKHKNGELKYNIANDENKIFDLVKKLKEEFTDFANNN
ncbi:PD-(D/E)XK nuclease family protein [Brachyspira hyodysenteriae]|uniref:PD-(D/E)XK nuclease family protein n=1 Tax=Brachyspira hyodysenteriae TaxID=159 RepID=UPI00063DA82E|nr:PD-(D/E)XK nuclease family protein [Brachyspira hyodysenteriae]KLI60971.1 hypothetical protein SZ44_03430 [Brachyspira hyodysenteriae]